ncbi:MAG: NAD(+) synthase, partial [Clostridia bacterium]|nr:NAD(+) synthase [Clostridia bacterium]
MKYGFTKVAAAIPTVTVADCAANTAEILDLMTKAHHKGAALVVFPELTITGYTCGDLFLQEHLLDRAEEALAEILEASKTLSPAYVVGLPLRRDGSLYNVAAVLHQGKLLGLVPKSFIPNYGEFYEMRHYTPAPQGNSCMTLLGQTVPFGTNLLFRSSIDRSFCFGVEICEDLWVPVSPSCGLSRAGALIIANQSAGNETIGKADYRRQLVSMQSAKNICGYIYANAGEGESTTDVVFSGHSLICENGSILAQRAPFGKDKLIVTEIDLQKLQHERRRMNTFMQDTAGYDVVEFELRAETLDLTRFVDPDPFVPADPAKRAERCASILEMQAHGLKKRLQHTRTKTAVIGISGGLDSTLALLVTCQAFDLIGKDRKDIYAVTMPCFGTTNRTKTNAHILCEALGVSLTEINIGKSVLQHFEDIGHDFDNHDVTFENGQARERTQVLMDIANQKWGMVIGTGDLSELALGWATYNGDHMSMYGVNGSIPKQLVRHLVAYCADVADTGVLRDVLLDILDTPVSPELLPPKDGEIAQKTEDLVGPYRLHDFMIFNTLRNGFSPAKNFFLARKAFAGIYEPDFILSWMKVFYRRFFNQQFKRSCLPDGPKVGSVTLSPRGDWRMPSDASAATWLK